MNTYLSKLLPTSRAQTSYAIIFKTRKFKTIVWKGFGFLVVRRLEYSGPRLKSMLCPVIVHFWKLLKEIIPVSHMKLDTWYETVTNMRMLVFRAFKRSLGYMHPWKILVKNTYFKVEETCSTNSLHYLSDRLTLKHYIKSCKSCFILYHFSTLLLNKELYSLSKEWSRFYSFVEKY